MFEKIKSLLGFAKEEEKLDPPYEYLTVEYTDHAKMKGIRDVHNKVIKHWIGGKLASELPYTPELLKSTIEAYEIPVYEDNAEFEEGFEPMPFQELGVSVYKK